MAWLATPAVKSNEALVENLERLRLLESPEVAEAMNKVDRALFVPPRQKAHAYDDCPQPIGFNVTISAPHMHAQCLELLLPHLKVSSSQQWTLSQPPSQCLASRVTGGQAGPLFSNPQARSPSPCLCPCQLFPCPSSSFRVSRPHLLPLS